MKAKLIKIGNSKGVRIPRLLLEESGLREEVELVVEGNAIVIRPRRRPREGWEEACKQMALCGDDKLIDGDWPATEWDNTEWEW